MKKNSFILLLFICHFLITINAQNSKTGSILNANINDTLLNITRMTIKLTSNHSWGLGSSTDSINFKVKGTELVADTMIVRREYGEHYGSSKPDTTYVNKINYSVKVSQINQFIKDIYSNQMLVQIPIDNGMQSIDLRNKMNGGASLMRYCKDGTYYYLEYCIYNNSNTIKLNYGFNDAYTRGILNDDIRNGISMEGEPQDIKTILDWLYIYTN